eukprot:TRINITY_DN8033_c0_g1_i1.p1 TRINITY_DN8033_c0_g1~~TRINITY_DN8033_c0_g1_i1.p1  ORF type:complete len:708 (+),score=181.97 TRINITY_DN8033_c0_g1_i1:66-2189(+)
MVPRFDPPAASQDFKRDLLAKLTSLGLQVQGSPAIKQLWCFLEAKPSERGEAAAKVMRLLAAELGALRAKDFVVWLTERRKREAITIEDDEAPVEPAKTSETAPTAAEQLPASEASQTSQVDETLVRMTTSAGELYFWDRRSQQACTQSIPEGIEPAWAGRKNSDGRTYYWRRFDGDKKAVWRLPPLQTEPAGGASSTGPELFDPEEPVVLDAGARSGHAPSELEADSNGQDPEEPVVLEAEARSGPALNELEADSNGQDPEEPVVLEAGACSGPALSELEADSNGQDPEEPVVLEAGACSGPALSELEADSNGQVRHAETSETRCGSDFEQTVSLGGSHPAVEEESQATSAHGRECFQESQAASSQGEAPQQRTSNRVKELSEKLMEASADSLQLRAELAALKKQFEELASAQASASASVSAPVAAASAPASTSTATAAGAQKARSRSRSRQRGHASPLVMPSSPGSSRQERQSPSPLKVEAGSPESSSEDRSLPSSPMGQSPPSSPLSSEASTCEKSPPQIGSEPRAPSPERRRSPECRARRSRSRSASQNYQGSQWSELGWSRATGASTERREVKLKPRPAAAPQQTEFREKSRTELAEKTTQKVASKACNALGTAPLAGKEAPASKLPPTSTAHVVAKLQPRVRREDASGAQVQVKLKRVSPPGEIGQSQAPCERAPCKRAKDTGGSEVRSVHLRRRLSFGGA